MTRRRVGLWLVGAFGGVGTTITLGLAAMARGLADRTGLVTELPLFRDLPLPEPGDFVVGGHDIRSTIVRGIGRGVPPELRVSSTRPGSPPAATSSTRPRPGSDPDLASVSGAAVARPGRLGGSQGRPNRTPGRRPRSPPTWPRSSPAESIDHLIVLNVASTEPPFPLGDVHQHWETLKRRAGRRRSELLPASALYALAAIEGGHTYINFTPSLGASIPAIARAGPGDRRALRRQGRQDRRDPDENRAGPDVRPPQSEGHELGRPQHLRQPRRPGARRSGQQDRRRSRPRTR